VGWRVGGLESWRVGGLEGWMVRRLKGFMVGGSVVRKLEGWRLKLECFRVGGSEGWKVGGLEVEGLKGLRVGGF
jgi:hypothetical protein